MKTRILITLAAAISLGACQSTPHKGVLPASVSGAESFACGDTWVRTHFTRDTLQLYRGAETHTLYPVPAASGAKFTTANDQAPVLSFWSKGDEASLQQGDADPVQCMRQTPPALPLTARGQEPGWLLTIDEQQLSVQYYYGEQQQQVPTPEPEAIDKGYRYRSDQVQVDIIYQVCADTMSGMPYPYKAQLQIKSETFSGCAGETRQWLASKEWVIEDINGEGIIDSSHITLTFTSDGEFYGNSGCNRYSGGYTLTGENLTTGSISSTMMACAEALMRQEEKAQDILQNIQRLETDETGALLLRDTAGGWLKAY